nr:AP-3 complex subunit sigma [Tanacetum cinerariifolium]
LCNRAENVSNFVQADSTFGPDTRLVYKTFATLYFIVIFDESENELAILDLMQVFVETLDKCFSNVCELDIVFNFSKVHTILNEIILGGQVVEMSSAEVVKSVDEISWFILFVETLDKCFSNVCELDIVFNFSKVHTILNEIILGGQVVEMSSAEVVKSVDEISWQEKNKFSHSSSNATTGWQRR